MNRNLTVALFFVFTSTCGLAPMFSQGAEPVTLYHFADPQPTPTPGSAVQIPSPTPVPTSTPAPERAPAPTSVQSSTPAPQRLSVPGAQKGAQGPASGGDLNSVLHEMDESSAGFRGAQANVELVQYTAVVKEKDLQTGQIFFRRKGHETEVALWISKPHPKQAVVKDDKLTFYDPRTKQLTDRSLGSNKADVEAVMNLGFGGRGQELLKDYNATFSGWEVIDGVRTARLELVAKSEKLRQFFTKVVLWIDPHRDVALQQQRFESSGDYQLTHYTNIQLNPHISADKFEIAK